MKKGGSTEQLSIEETSNGTPWEIRGIFSDHYLRHRLREVSDWPSDAETALAYQKCRDLIMKNKERLSRHANEDQARHIFIEPILNLLGFHFIPEASLPGVRKTTPDYLLFGDEQSKDAALDVSPRERYAHAISLAEAKRYRHNLGAVSTHETAGKFPHQQINEYLREAVDQNLRKPHFGWAILTNGQEWRLYYRLANSYSYFSLDLEQAVNSREYFKYFWMLFHASAFLQDGNGECRLDRVLDKSLQHSAALESDLRKRVYRLVEKLANGFYGRKKNNIREEELQELYDTCLIYMYRLLFILYAEGRDLLPITEHRAGSNLGYRTRYSLNRLHEQVKKIRPEEEALYRLYNEIDELFSLIDGSDAAMNELLGVPRYDGRLFDTEKAPRLIEWKLGNYTLASVLRGLMFSFRQARIGESEEVSFDEAIDYSELSVRQLGSIYEGLLEHRLVIGKGSALTLVDESSEKRVDDGKPSKRKQSGSYYTPDFIVKYIIEKTLRPLLDQIEADPAVKIAREAELVDNSFADRTLQLKILDPAMGSGHFLVKATEFLAEEIAYHPTTRLAVTNAPYNLPHDLAEVAHWRRRVVESCIYGVDINPLAVELSKLSLWLTCISSSEPLSFLDHHIHCGNALIGSWIEDLNHLKRAGEKTETLLTVTGLNEAMSGAIDYLKVIRHSPSSRLDAVKEKQAIWEQEVKKRIAPFNAIADLRTAFELGLKLENKEYTQQVAELIDDFSTLSGDAKKLKNQLKFFHWELTFPEVFSPSVSDRGFDAVVGNPPYVRSGGFPEIKQYLAAHYNTYDGVADLYTYFIEQGINLLRPEGRLGYIVSNKWMKSEYGFALREFLLNYNIEVLVDFGELRVFKSSATFPLIMILKKARKRSQPLYTGLKILFEDDERLTKEIERVAIPLEDSSLKASGFILVNIETQALLEKMGTAGFPLTEYLNGEIYRGLVTGFNTAYLISAEQRSQLIRKDKKSAEIIVPWSIGADVRKWSINYRNQFLILAGIGIDLSDEPDRMGGEYPAVFEHLQKYKGALQERWDKGSHWWELRACDYYEVFKKPKIVWPDMAKESRFAMDYSGLYFGNTVYFTPVEDLFLLGLLNSKAVWFYLSKIAVALGDSEKGGRVRHYRQYMATIPTVINGRKEEISNLVRNALKLKELLRCTAGLAEARRLENQLSVAESEIDRLVYELYGLTQKEIDIVEGRAT